MSADVSIFCEIQITAKLYWLEVWILLKFWSLLRVPIRKPIGKSMNYCMCTKHSCYIAFGTSKRDISATCASILMSRVPLESSWFALAETAFKNHFGMKKLSIWGSWMQNVQKPRVGVFIQARSHFNYLVALEFGADSLCAYAQSCKMWDEAH